jgi:hypothetical protein
VRRLPARYDRFVSIGVHEHAGRDCNEQWILNAESKPVSARAKPESADQAMQQLHEFHRTDGQGGWRRLRQMRPFAFWLLVLTDPELFQRTFVTRRRHFAVLRVPPVNEDRALIVAQTNGRGASIRAAYDASVRAYYRDKNWYAAHQAADSQRRLEQERRDLLKRLGEARRRWLGEQHPPLRWNVVRAARELSWPVQRLRTQLDRLSIRTAEVTESRHEFWDRALLYATAERMKQGLPMGSIAVFRHGGIHRSHIATADIQYLRNRLAEIVQMIARGEVAT